MTSGLLSSDLSSLPEATRRCLPLRQVVGEVDNAPTETCIELGLGTAPGIRESFCRQADFCKGSRTLDSRVEGRGK